MMPIHYSDHAIHRSQQRGIPPFMDILLDKFGIETHVGQGCLRLVLTKKSFKKMAGEFGHEVAAKFKEYRGIYKIEDQMGKVITFGHQIKRRKSK